MNTSTKTFIATRFEHGAQYTDFVLAVNEVDAREICEKKNWRYEGEIRSIMKSKDEVLKRFGRNVIFTLVAVLLVLAGFFGIFVALSVLGAIFYANSILGIAVLIVAVVLVVAAIQTAIGL